MWILSASFLCLTPERNEDPPAKDMFPQFYAPQTEVGHGNQHGQDELCATRVGTVNGASKPWAEPSPATHGSPPARRYLVFSILLIQKSLCKCEMKPMGTSISAIIFKVSHL